MRVGDKERHHNSNYEQSKVSTGPDEAGIGPVILWTLTNIGSAIIGWAVSLILDSATSPSDKEEDKEPKDPKYRPEGRC